MGQYLAIGLRISASVSKKEVEKHLSDGKSVDGVLGQIEEECQLADIYDRREEGDYYVYALKQDILDKEYIPFLEKFYALRYQAEDNSDSDDVVAKLKELPDSNARLALLEDRCFQTYQQGDDVDYVYIGKFRSDYVRVFNSNAILSIDGKIIMECYGSVFDFFSRSIRAMMSEFELSKALTVWIDG